MVGVAYVELYRKNVASGNSLEAERYAQLAENLLNRVPEFMGKRRLLARGFPLEIFIDRKLRKWAHNAKERNIRFVDGIGVSPAEEMIYIWSKSSKNTSVEENIILTEGFKSCRWI